MVRRDEKGRFLPGASGNPKGRSPKERELRYYEITMQACTYKEWKAIVKRAVQDALRGDASARRWLSEYLIGKPEENIEAGLEILIRRINAEDGDD